MMMMITVLYNICFQRVKCPFKLHFGIQVLLEFIFYEQEWMVCNNILAMMSIKFVCFQRQCLVRATKILFTGYICGLLDMSHTIVRTRVCGSYIPSCVIATMSAYGYATTWTLPSGIVDNQTTLAAMKIVSTSGQTRTTNGTMHRAIISIASFAKIAI